MRSHFLGDFLQEMTAIIINFPINFKRIYVRKFDSSFFHSRNFLDWSPKPESTFKFLENLEIQNIKWLNEKKLNKHALIICRILYKSKNLPSSLRSPNPWKSKWWDAYGWAGRPCSHIWETALSPSWSWTLKRIHWQVFAPFINFLKSF